MLPDELTILGWSRWLGLLTCFAGAAWLDHKYRRISNSYWISWSKVAIILWSLEFLVLGARWEIWATAVAAVALASTSVIGRPTLKDILSGSLLDILVSFSYLVGLAGIVFGCLTYGGISPIDILFGDATEEAILWWRTASVLVLIWLFSMMWKIRLLHGGADAKGLMWVALLMPNWSTIPPLIETDSWAESMIHMPPAFSLLIWGALSFLLIPPGFLYYNFKKGDLTSFSDLRLAWHSRRMDLESIATSHVWILDEVIDKADGTRGVRTRKRAPSKSPTQEQALELIRQLKELGQDSAWVSHKWPLLTFLFFAIVPLFLFGDPYSFILLPLFG